MSDQDAPKIEFAGELRRIDVRPGDRFVLTTPNTLSPRQGQETAEMLGCFLGVAPGEVMVIGGGFQLGVIRQEAGEQG